MATQEGQRPHLCLPRPAAQGLFGRLGDKFGGWGGSKVGYVLQVRSGLWAGVSARLGGLRAGNVLCTHWRVAALLPHVQRARCRPGIALFMPCCGPSNVLRLLCLCEQEGAIPDLDAYYEKLGSFAGIYARHVFDRMAKTVPKAIILCQVSRNLRSSSSYAAASCFKPVGVRM